MCIFSQPPTHLDMYKVHTHRPKNTYTYTHTRTLRDTHVHTKGHTCRYTYTYTRAQTVHTHTRLHTLGHTRVHTHVRAQTWTRPGPDPSRTSVLIVKRGGGGGLLHRRRWRTEWEGSEFPVSSCTPAEDTESWRASATSPCDHCPLLRPRLSACLSCHLVCPGRVGGQDRFLRPRGWSASVRAGSKPPCVHKGTRYARPGRPRGLPQILVKARDTGGINPLGDARSCPLALRPHPRTRGCCVLLRLDPRPPAASLVPRTPRPYAKPLAASASAGLEIPPPPTTPSPPFSSRTGPSAPPARPVFLGRVPAPGALRGGRGRGSCANRLRPHRASGPSLAPDTGRLEGRGCGTGSEPCKTGAGVVCARGPGPWTVVRDDAGDAGLSVYSTPDGPGRPRDPVLLPPLSPVLRWVVPWTPA